MYICSIGLCLLLILRILRVTGNTNNSENKRTFTEAATCYYCMAMSCGSSVCESVDSEWPPTTATSTTDSTTKSTAGSSLLSVLLCPKWKFVVGVCTAANKLQSSSAYFAMAATSISHYSILYRAFSARDHNSVY